MDLTRTPVRGTALTPRAVHGHRLRVLVADDHAILRQALRLLLEVRGEVDVVGEATNGREAIELTERLRPDVVLMDMAMPALNGIEATRQIRKRVSRTRVLMLTGYVEDDQVLEALRAGASGYIVKHSDVSELLLAIQAISRGNLYFSSSISEEMTARDYLWKAKNTACKSTYDLLSGREREVLQLIAEGNSNQTIANDLYISVKTVEAHKAHIMTKLNAKNRTDLIRYALRKGIVNLDSFDEGFGAPVQAAG
jgi:DNA-binding NarL/FixJ family response regulator